MQFGNVGINPEAFRDYTKEKFFQQFRGTMDFDLEKAWQELSAYLGKIEPKETLFENEKFPEKLKRMRKRKPHTGNPDN